MDRYFSGEALYGDDFDSEQIAEWYADEAEGYAGLGARDRTRYEYEYHALNSLHAFRYLQAPEYRSVLGFGSAYGEELLPILPRARQLTIVDPSDAFISREIHGVPVTYVKPQPSGVLPFGDEQFDLITCFGVLHHVPNVSFVMKELARTTRKGGTVLIREPIVSMGDWRQPRTGLTKRERGIPLHLLHSMAQAAGLVTAHSSVCNFPPAEKLLRRVRRDIYNSELMTRVDALLSRAFAWNVNYHPRNFIQLFRPTSAFLVLHRA